MKGTFTIVCLLIITSIVFSQEKVLDNAYLKCQYEYTLQSDTLSGKTRDDLLILQIGENISKCYSHYSNQIDSIDALPNGDNIIGKMTITDGLSLQDFIYEDDLNAQQWEIRDSTKTILNYSCQMAACNFRGRQWTASFITDIPVSDGPWKLSGLPGLIMEAYDKGNQYVFTIVGIQKVTEEPFIFSETYDGSKRFEKSNRINFLKAKKKYLMDMNGYIEMETGIDLSGGNPPKIMRYDLLELDYK